MGQNVKTRACAGRFPGIGTRKVRPTDRPTSSMDEANDCNDVMLAEIQTNHKPLHILDFRERPFLSPFSAG